MDEILSSMPVTDAHQLRTSSSLITATLTSGNILKEAPSFPSISPKATNLIVISKSSDSANVVVLKLALFISLYFSARSRWIIISVSSRQAVAIKPNTHQAFNRTFINEPAPPFFQLQYPNLDNSTYTVAQTRSSRRVLCGSASRRAGLAAPRPVCHIWPISRSLQDAPTGSVAPKDKQPPRSAKCSSCPGHWSQARRCQPRRPSKKP